MKTFYLATAMLLSTFAATAQTEQGTININGLFGSNGGGQLQSTDAFNRFKLNVGANVGYFVKNNWEIGAGVQTGFNTLKQKAPFNDLFNLDKARTITFAPQLYSKYYFGTKQLKPFAVISTGYNWQFDRSTYNGVTTKGRLNYLNYGGGAGLAWFPSKKVGLFTQLTYDRFYSDMMDQGALNLNFGVQINLGKK
jgi:hypothetical protein